VFPSGERLGKIDPPLAVAVPLVLVVRQVVAPLVRSRRNRSPSPLVSVRPETMSVAWLRKTSFLLSPLNSGLERNELPLGVVVRDRAEWVTPLVVPGARSRKNMSGCPLLSVTPATRSAPPSSKTRNLPSGLNFRSSARNE